MGILNAALTFLVLAIFVAGMLQAGRVYDDTITRMQPHLHTIQKGMKFHEPD